MSGAQVRSRKKPKADEKPHVDEQTIRKQGLCWHFIRKGECRYGASCRFAHEEPALAVPATGSDVGEVGQAVPPPPAVVAEAEAEGVCAADEGSSVALAASGSASTLHSAPETETAT